LVVGFSGFFEKLLAAKTDFGIVVVESFFEGRSLTRESMVCLGFGWACVGEGATKVSRRPRVKVVRVIVKGVGDSFMVFPGIGGRMILI